MIFNRLEQSQLAMLRWLYDRFLQLIIYPSIWVAAAIASLAIFTQQVLEIGYDWQPIALIFVTALIPYNLDRIFDSYVQEIPDDKAQLFFRQPCIWALLIGAIAATTFLLYNAPLGVRYASIAGIVPLLYGTPLFPLKNSSQWQWYRLKDIPGSKAWIVGSTLTYAVIALPIAYAGTKFDTVSALTVGDAEFSSAYPTTVLTTLFMFVFIVTNSHVFDVRDLESDRKKGVVTLPILAGVRGTKIILTVMNLSMLLTLIVAWVGNIMTYYPEMIFATVINLIYIWRVKVNTPRWVYSIWIEGCLFMPILANWFKRAIF